jgi:hypothetical protein
MAVAAADMRHHGRVRDGLERARLGRASLLAWSAIGVMVCSRSRSIRRAF